MVFFYQTNRKIASDDDELQSDQRGKRVDSLNYYKNQLTELNNAVEFMQREKRRIVEEGNDRINATEWIANIFQFASETASNSLRRDKKNQGLIVGFQDRKSANGNLFKQIAIDFFFGGFTFFNRNFDAVVDTVSGSTLSSTGFVTMNDMATVVAAVKSPLSHDPDVLRVKIAPDPRDLIWPNVHLNNTYCKGRELTVSSSYFICALENANSALTEKIFSLTFKANVILGFGALLWSTVVASIQAWATIDRISEVPGFSWMNSFNTNPSFSSFVNGYLPVVSLLAIISILPLIFEQVAMTFENRKTKTDVQDSMLGRYFYYQVRNFHCIYIMLKFSNNHILTISSSILLKACKYLCHSYCWFYLDIVRGTC